MENPINKLVILFKNGHEEKRNLFYLAYAKLYIKKHPDKANMKSAIWYNSEGKANQLYKAKAEKEKKVEHKLAKFKHKRFHKED